MRVFFVIQKSDEFSLVCFASALHPQQPVLWYLLRSLVDSDCLFLIVPIATPAEFAHFRAALLRLWSSYQLRRADDDDDLP